MRHTTALWYNDIYMLAFINSWVKNPTDKEEHTFYVFTLSRKVEKKKRKERISYLFALFGFELVFFNYQN